MTDEVLATLIALIAGLASGTRFTLRELLRDQWDALHGGHPQLFGKQFADAVDQGKVEGVERYGVRISGNQNVWRKL